MMKILPVTPPALQTNIVAPTSDNPGTVPPWLTPIRHGASNGNHGIVPPWFTGTSFDAAALPVEAPSLAGAAAQVASAS